MMSLTGRRSPNGNDGGARPGVFLRAVTDDPGSTRGSASSRQVAREALIECGEPLSPKLRGGGLSAMDACIPLTPGR